MKPKQINIDGVLYDLMAVPLPYPARTPLFTTIDGKPVYKGDKRWAVFVGSGFGFEVMKPIEWPVIGKPYGVDVYVYFFSTEEAAEQWIADNKPLYSLNDLLAALPDEASKEGVAAILRAKKSSL